MNYFPMHVSSGWCLAIVLMTAMTSPSATAQTPLPPVPKDVWVNAETGLDTNNGSFRFPWQTLGYALDEAATVNVDSDPHNNIGKIYVMYTARPIAPQGFGVPVIGGAPALDGREDPMHAFPFEVPENVSVVGVADSSGNKPWVTVYETQHTAIPSKLTYTWPKIAVGSPLLARLGTTKPMFILATGATLNNLFLDGSPFRTKLNPANGTVVPLLGVYVDDSQDVTIANCVIHDMHDGIIFQENGVTAVDANLTLRRLTSGNVQSCVISGSFPGFPRFPSVTVASESTFALANDQGHAVCTSPFP